MILKKEYAEYEHEFFGKQALDTLKHRLQSLKNREDIPGSVYDLEEVLTKYKVKFIDTVEFSRNSRVN
ncbi:MAG: hypothetical protein K0Q73_5373 [Paenibacillus sp.]|jgi:hypothetical protein|nr:hypothetical protein [Paenibacillus sp.]